MGRIGQMGLVGHCYIRRSKKNVTSVSDEADGARGSMLHTKFEISDEFTKLQMSHH